MRVPIRTAQRQESSISPAGSQSAAMRVAQADVTVFTFPRSSNLCTRTTFGLWAGCMEVEMHSWKSWSRSAPFLLLSLLLSSSLPAKAEEVGRGVLCNTKEQVERFVAL